MDMSMNIRPEIRQEIKLEIKQVLSLEDTLDKKTEKFMYEFVDEEKVKLYKLFSPNWEKNEEIYSGISVKRNEQNILLDMFTEGIVEYYSGLEKPPKRDIVVEIYQKSPLRAVKRFVLGGG